MHRSLLGWLSLQLLTMCRVSDVIRVTLDAATAGVTVRVSAEICGKWDLLRSFELISLRNG